jgi:hypothetical protein
MVKTQVQIPEHLYREGKRIAVEYEMSFADVVRRGLERVIPSFPPRGRERVQWSLPELDLGLTEDPFEDPDWREHVNSDRGSEASRPRVGRGRRRRRS